MKRAGIELTPLTFMNSSVSIQTSADWEIIRQEKLKVVVASMVFRAADVFLRGIKGTERDANKAEPEKLWAALSSNIGSLCAFFDAVILEDRLPMYDYAMTFPPDFHTGKHGLVDVCNRDEPVLVTITVGFEAYREVKEAAIATLRKLPPIPAAAASDILGEMSAFDWEWRPDLWRDGAEGTEDERRLDSFRYGGLLFSGYSQRTGADHLLQPKRARLYLASALCSERANDEKALFRELARIARETPAGLERSCELPDTGVSNSSVSSISFPSLSVCRNRITSPCCGLGT